MPILGLRPFRPCPPSLACRCTGRSRGCAVAWSLMELATKQTKGTSCSEQPSELRRADCFGKKTKQCELPNGRCSSACQPGCKGHFRLASPCVARHPIYGSEHQAGDPWAMLETGMPCQPHWSPQQHLPTRVALCRPLQVAAPDCGLAQPTDYPHSRTWNRHNDMLMLAKLTRCHSGLGSCAGLVGCLRPRQQLGPCCEHRFLD